MRSTLSIRRAGMTLVELLVVITILGLLAVTVLPSLATSAESRRTRETTRMVSSFIAKAQGRAIGRQEWSGLKLAAVNASSVAAIDLFLADVPEAYRGDTTSAALTISGTPSSTMATAVPASAGDISFSGSVGIQPGDSIRFDGRGTPYEISSASSTSIIFKLRGNSAVAKEDVGHSAHNTPWPALNVPHTFEIYRQPQPSGLPLTLAGGRAIDLYWSGFGPPQSNGIAGTYQQFSPLGGAGSSVSILFDSVGRLRQLVIGAYRYTVTGPVYLLIGRADRAGQGYGTLNINDDLLGANWQYPDSYWIAIDPITGLVRTAECAPEVSSWNSPPSSWTGTLIEWKLFRSQDWIRQALLAGGT